MSNKTKSFQELLWEMDDATAKEIAVAYEENPERAQWLDQHFPLSDQIDCEIVKHREVHFSGNFQIMIAYYEANGMGCCPEFELKRIKELLKIESDLNDNLAGMLLSGPDIEQVLQAKNGYKKLRELCETPGTENSAARLIAELILSETESEVEQTTEAILRRGPDMIPGLLSLLNSEEFANPLFPGHGEAPSIAVTCLGHLQGEQAIHPLFEKIGQDDFFEEENAIEALKNIGQPALDFLLRIIRSPSRTSNTERAAIALNAFKASPEVSISCLEVLLAADPKKEERLASYLILNCDALPPGKEQESFLNLMKNKEFPRHLIEEMKISSRDWNK